MTVEITDTPRIPADDRLQIIAIAPGIHRAVIRYGFMQQPKLPVTLRLAEKLGLEVDLDAVTYYVGREALVPGETMPGMIRFGSRLFSFLARNARPATTYYGLPPEHVVALGIRVKV